MEESQDDNQQPQEEISFDSLPFLFPDSWRPALLRWKRAAVERERELAHRRQARLQGLQDYVRQRLEEIQVKKQLTAASVSDADSDLPRSANQDPRVVTRDFPSAVRPTSDFPSAVDSPPNPQLTISTQYTRPSTQQSLPSTQQPLPSTQQPFPSTQQPHPSAQQPLPSTQQPLPSTQQSHPSTQLSLPATQKQALLTSTLPPPPPTHNSYVSPRRKLFPSNSSRGSQTRATAKDPYALVTAMARGFLTRRLLQAQKVRDVIKTIKEASSVLSALATPISEQDEALRERVSIQLQVARRTLHEIFFTLPVEEQMAYIAHSRILVWEQRRRATASQPYLTGGVARGRSEGVVRGRLSTATMRAIERRRQVAAVGDRGTVVGGTSTAADKRRTRQKRLTTVSGSSRDQQNTSRSSRDQQGSFRSSTDQQDSFRSSRDQQGSSRINREQQGSFKSSTDQQDTSRSSRDQQGPSRSSRDQQGPSRSSRSQGGTVRNTKMANTSVRPSKSVRKAPKLAKPKKI